VGLLERVNSQVGLSRPKNLSLDEYASWFSFGGVNYPMLQTTYSTLDQERIAWSADQAARRSGPVFSLVLARMQVFSQIRFAWTRFSGAQPGDLFGTTDLRVLEQPWPGGTTADLLARMEWDASAAGNSYTRRKGDTLHRLHPSWVIIVMGSQEDAENPAMAADTTVVGYLFVPPGGKIRFFQPQQICHYAPVPDPDRHFLGMSWITPVLRELQGDMGSTEHKYKFFENAATPNLAISFDPSIDIDKVRAFKELLEEEHQGVAHAWKTLYLGGGASPTPVGNNFKDMDYAIVQGRAESRLASAAGVPPSWVGFAEGLQGSSLNAGNMNQARRRFSDGTMAHLWGNAAASLEPVLDRPRDKRGAPVLGASLWYDDRIPVMREDAGDLATIQAQEATTMAALYMAGWTPESVVQAVKNNDWTLLTHSGRPSVQTQPASGGQSPPALVPAGANG